MTATATPPRPHSRPATRRSRSADAPILGLLLVLFGAAWLLRESGVIGLSWQAILAGLLVVLGVSMVATAKSRGGGLVLVGIALTVALATTSSVSLDTSSMHGGIGERRFHPTALEAPATSYDLFIGHMVIDLTDATRAMATASTASTASTDTPAAPVTDASQPKTVRATLGFGQIEVVVPDALGQNVRIVTHVRWGGDVQLFGTNVAQGGGPADRVQGPPNAPLVLDLSVAGGQIVVRSEDATRGSVGPFRSRVARAGR